MSADWNGLDLQSELSELLGDTSTTFKARVLKWLNDTQSDICNRHDWIFLTENAEKILQSGVEHQSIVTAAPGAASVAVSTGGSLTEGSSYKIYVTFVESNGLETMAGVGSASVTATATDKQIDITSIPVSVEPLVTSRKIYLQKDGGLIYFSQEIVDNVTTVATVSSETTSLVEAPDYCAVKEINGNPRIETSSQLEYLPIDQMRLRYQGTFSTGTPQYWAPLSDNKALFFPIPSSALTLKYYFQKRPSRIYASSDSQPTLPIEFKAVLKAGVIAFGYEYRDRNGQESKRAIYESLLEKAMTELYSKYRGRSQVRDVVGDAQGFYTTEI